MSLKITEW